jgi:hypothetical protein
LVLAASVLARNVCDGTVELAAKDDIFVHDGRDAIDGLQAGSSLLGERGSAGQDEGREEIRKEFLHGMGSGTKSLSV